MAVGQIAPARKRRRTQAERTALSEKLLLRAAVKLIARQGYSKTTLAEVGREAGYSAALVSHRFGSKEGLLRTLIDAITRRFWQDQLVPAIEGRSGLDALCAMADVYLGELTAREERLRGLYVLMGEALGPVPEIRKMFAALNEWMRAGAERSIEKGMADGGIRPDVDPKAEAAAYVALLRGFAMQWLIDPGCLDLARMRACVGDTLSRSLAPGGSTSRRIPA